MSLWRERERDGKEREREKRRRARKGGESGVRKRTKTRRKEKAMLSFDQTLLSFLVLPLAGCSSSLSEGRGELRARRSACRKGQRPGESKPSKERE